MKNAAVGSGKEDRPTASSTTASQAAVDRKLAIMEGAIDFLRGNVDYAELQYRREVKEVADQVMALHPTLDCKDTSSLLLERAVRKTVESKSSIRLPNGPEGLYTVIERKQALYSLLKTRTKYSLLTDQYGVPERTLRKDKKDFQRRIDLSDEELKVLCIHPDLDHHLLAVINAMPFPGRGPAKVLSVAERDAAALIFEECDCSGFGFSLNGMRAYVKEFVKNLAAHVAEDPGGKLANFQCSKAWVSSTFFSADGIKASIPEANPRLTKTSGISIKRAAAAHPAFHEAMLDMFAEFDRLLIEQGLVGPNGPDPDLIFNCDEIGCDPDGAHRRTYCLFKTAKERRFLLKSGEKAAFWVSIILIITASGILLPPIVIHQGGGDGDTISKHFVMNLPPDAVVTTTSSGYDDKETFRLVVDTIRRYIASLPAEKRARHGVLYMDGHYSHTDVESLRGLLDNSIHPRFLKSNDSINDQPLDMGVNSKVAACYNSMCELWKIKHPGEKITPPVFNTIFHEAWNEIHGDAGIPDAIRRAFGRSGLYPLQGGKSDGRAAESTPSPAAIASKLKLSRPLLPTAAVQTQQTEARDGGAASSSVSTLPPAAVEEVIVLPMPGTSEDVCVTVAKPGQPMYGVVMRSASVQWFNQAFIVPAQENATRRAEEAKAKRLKVPKRAAGCLRVPSTQRGLCVTETVLEQYDAVEVAQEQQKAAKRQRTLANAEKHSADHAACKAIAMAASTKLLAVRNVAAVLASARLADLKAMYKIWLKPKLNGPIPTRKNDLYTKVAEVMESMLAEGAVSPATSVNGSQGTEDCSSDDDDDDDDGESTTTSSAASDD